jgi:RNA polymerase sigma factor (sigma-70 family)
MQRRATNLVSDDISPMLKARFEQAYLLHAQTVRRHLTYLTGDSAIAEDLTQETFGKLYERQLAGENDELLNPQAWLLTVASNLAYNHFRTEGRRDAREASTEVPSRGADIDDVLDVRRVLSELDQRDRMVLMLRHAGFSYADVAEAVGIAPTSVGTILARAQRRFRKAYDGTRPGAGEKE